MAGKPDLADRKRGDTPRDYEDASVTRRGGGGGKTASSPSPTPPRRRTRIDTTTTDDTDTDAGDRHARGSNEDGGKNGGKTRTCGERTGRERDSSG